MKKLFLGLSLVALLAGCASRDNGNGMGGTSDDYNSNIGNSSDQYNNNATHGTGSTIATNNATDQGMQP